MILIKKVLFFTLFTLSSYAAYAAERIVAVALDGTGEFTGCKVKLLLPSPMLL